MRRAGVSRMAAPEVERYMLIYKRGDDLRQDQLVVQILSLMDRLLKRENLDLKLTPYRCDPGPTSELTHVHALPMWGRMTGPQPVLKPLPRNVSAS